MNENKAYIDAILQAIEQKKQDVIEEYDHRIQQITDEHSYPNLYYALAEIFHNTKEQGELGIALLKSCLTDEFFQTATVSNRVNQIVFENKEFQVIFSKCLEKVIQVKYKNSGIPSSYYPSVRNDVVHLADLTEQFLQNKTIKNFLILADFNCRRYQKNPIATLLKYYHTYKDCNATWLEKVRHMQEVDKEKQAKYEQEQRQFEQKQEYAKAFLSSLTSLTQFTDCGYYIKKYGIQQENGDISYC